MIREIREITLMAYMTVITKALKAVTNDLSLKYDPIEKPYY